MIPLKDDNPSNSLPVITTGIILINILVFIYEAKFGEDIQLLVNLFGAIPHNVVENNLIHSLIPLSSRYTILTYMFIHGGAIHLLSNMLYLWIFGNSIEDYLGHIKFFIFYMLCGVLAALIHILSNPSSEIPMVGASGAISGVMGAYMILYPNARISVLAFFGFFVRVIKVPALFFIGFWAVVQLVSSAYSAKSNEGVAWFAHIGGFIAGLLFIKVFRKRRS